MSNLDRLTPSKFQRLLPEPLIDGKLNEACLEPDMVELAIERYDEQSRRPGSLGEYWTYDGYPPWWPHYLGVMGERGTGDLMGWTDPIIGKRGGPDPGYDWRKFLKFDGKASLWLIDSKTFDAAQKLNDEAVMLAAKQAKRMSDRTLYVWCAYHLQHDMAWPVGWQTGARLKLVEQNSCGDWRIKRKDLLPMSDLVRSTWTNLPSAVLAS